MKINAERLKHPYRTFGEIGSAMREAGPHEVRKELVIYSRDNAVLLGSVAAIEGVMMTTPTPGYVAAGFGVAALGALVGSFGHEFKYNRDRADEFWTEVAKEDEAWDRWGEREGLAPGLPRSRADYPIHVTKEGIVRYTNPEQRKSLRDLSALSELTALNHPGSKPFQGYRRDYTFTDYALPADPRVLDGEILLFHHTRRDGSWKSKTLQACGIDMTLESGPIMVEREISYYHLRSLLGFVEVGVEAAEHRFPHSGGKITRRAVSTEEVHNLQRKIFAGLPPLDIYG